MSHSEVSCEPGFTGGFRRGAPWPALSAQQGRQFLREASRLALLFDGRLFAEPGPERILDLYEDEGIACLPRLRGMFSFALYDGRSERLYLVRDRLGVKPLYYAEKDGAFEFGSRIKPLFESGFVPPAIDPEGLRHFCLGVRRSQDTIFRGIRSVPAGHYLEARRGGAAVKQWWDLRFPAAGETAGKPASYYVEGLEAALAEAVRLQMPDDETPTALLLSGGIGSSALGCLIKERRPLPAYCISFHEKGARRFDESRYAHEVAGRLAFPLQEMDYKRRYINDFFLETLWHTECPTYHIEMQTSIPFYLAFRAMADAGIKVAFTGGGSNELLAGSLHHRLDKVRALCARRPLVRHEALYRRFTPNPRENHSFFQSLHRKILEVYGHNLAFFAWIKDIGLVRDGLANLLSREMAAAIGKDRLALPLDLGLDAGRYADFAELDRALYVDMKTRLADFILLEEHQVPLAFGMEHRMPYLDDKVVEFAAAIPPNLKIRGLIEKYALKKMIDRRIPMELFTRGRRAFNAPFGADVFRNKDSSVFNELLSQAALREAGYFDPDFVGGIHRKFLACQDPLLWPAYYFILERALIVQGLHHLFIKKAWSPSTPRAASPRREKSKPPRSRQAAR